MLYAVKVAFNSELLKIDGDEILVGVSSKPKRGLANRELVRKLAKHFNVPVSHIRIISGYKSKKKIVEIQMEDDK
jgi:uncharacterized protein (TIGR00251 family)